jgi:hypothetical protein
VGRGPWPESSRTDSNRNLLNPTACLNNLLVYLPLCPSTYDSAPLRLKCFDPSKPPPLCVVQSGDGGGKKLPGLLLADDEGSRWMLSTKV